MGLFGFGRKTEEPKTLSLRDESGRLVGRYYGEIKDHLPQGKGRIIYGDFSGCEDPDDIPLADRIYRIEEGTYQAGVLEGTGKITLGRGFLKDNHCDSGEEEILYEGEFHDGEAHGKGKLYLGGKTVPEKNPERRLQECYRLFRDNYLNEDQIRSEEWRQGSGAAFLNGNVLSYEGEFTNGVITGYGLVRYRNGNVYEGELLAGMRHGKGVWNQADGSRWSGNFSIGDEFTGTIEYPDGTCFEGCMKGSLEMEPEGDVVYRFPSGNVFRGQAGEETYDLVWQGTVHKMTQRYLRGTLTFADGSVAAGSLRHQPDHPERPFVFTPSEGGCPVCGRDFSGEGDCPSCGFARSLDLKRYMTLCELNQETLDAWQQGVYEKRKQIKL